MSVPLIFAPNQIQAPKPELSAFTAQINQNFRYLSNVLVGTSVAVPGVVANGILALSQMQLDIATLQGDVVVINAEIAALTAVSTYEAENKSGGTVHAGQAVRVHSSGSGIDLAVAAGSLAATARGLVTADAASTLQTDVRIGGTLTLPDWTAATGAATLTPNADYWVDATTPGKLTTVPTLVVGQFQQRVGTALNTLTMDVSIEEPFIN